MGFDVDLSEVRAVSSRISTAGPRLGATASAAMRKMAHDIETAAKDAAPVASGDLQASITTDMTGDGRSGNIAVEIGPTVDYGKYQEFGTSVMPASPFMGPAFDAHSGQYSEALAELAAKVV